MTVIDLSSLRAYQRDAVDFIASLDGKAGLFAEMRTGKTRIALAYALARHERVLAVAPLSALGIWEREARALGYTGDVQLLISGTIEQRAAQLSRMGAGLAVVNHDAYWQPALRKAIVNWRPPAVVFDEASRIKDRAAKRSRFAHTFPLYPWSECRIAATGTPITNGGYSNLFSIFKAVRLDAFGSDWKWFERRYCVMGGYFNHEIVRYNNEAEIKATLAKYAYQIAKSAALPELPPEQSVIIPVKLDSKTRARYDAMVRDSLLRLELDYGKLGAVATAPLALVRLMRLQQITSGFINARLDDGTYTQETLDLSDEKLQLTLELVRQARDEGERVVVVGRFRREIERLRQALGLAHADVLSGDTPALARKTFEERHMRGEIPVALGQERAIAMGLDLDAASAMICPSVDFSIENFAQKRDRIYGPRQLRPVGYYYLCASGTVDEKILHDLRAGVDVAARMLSLDYVKWLLS